MVGMILLMSIGGDLGGCMFKFSIILLSLLLSVGCFFLGKHLTYYKFLSTNNFILKRDLDIYSPEGQGTIPAGSMVHKYRELPEITTYIVLVNIKERNVMEAVSDFKGLSPIPAFPSE